jgi:peptidoglycan/xylan/chitin deacetylase (PgdA/CDA1 family)
MSQTVRTQIGRLKRYLRPKVVSLLGQFPSIGSIAGAGHILMFHRVVPPEETSPYGMAAFETTPQVLEKSVMYFLRRGYKVVSLDEMCDFLSRDVVAERFIVLTFDDGYKDTLTHAYPILKAYNAPFTINITWNYVERAIIKWDYLAEEIIAEHDTIVIGAGGERIELDCSTPDRKMESYGTLMEILYEMSDAGSVEEMKAFFNSYRRDIYAKTNELMLDWPQVEELARDPLVTIGAHSMNHFILSRLSDDQARDEIRLSKTRLEERLGEKVSHFAYPYGRAHEAGTREFEIVRQCGFRTGTTGEKGNIFKQHSHRLQSLPRFCLGSNCTEAHLSAIANGSLPFIANRFRRLPK